MKPKLVVLFAALAVAAVPVASWAKTGLHVRVTPRIGSPTARFVVRLRLPRATGSHKGVMRQYVLVATASKQRAGCLSQISAPVPGGQARHRVRVTLDPTSRSSRWCVGKYRGEVRELDSPICPPGKVCPAQVQIRRVGRFALRVRAVDAKAPMFGGLQSATACTPGPTRPGQTTPFTLTWKAATDDKTPSSQIVYDIYLATAVGGERFSQPTWTTHAGVTSYRTPGLSSHGTYYFVVRARDRAGNEDRNKVERQGNDRCV